MLHIPRAQLGAPIVETLCGQPIANSPQVPDRFDPDDPEVCPACRACITPEKLDEVCICGHHQVEHEHQSAKCHGDFAPGHACSCETFRPCTGVAGDADTTNPSVDVGHRFPDGYFHHEAVVDIRHGYIDKWGGDAMVPGQFLPEFMQMKVKAGDILHIRCHEPGRFVAFIRCDDGQLYLLAFNRLEPTHDPKARSL